MFDPDVASTIYHDVYKSLSWSVYLALIKLWHSRYLYIRYNDSVTKYCKIETINGKLYQKIYSYGIYRYLALSDDCKLMLF